VARGSYHISLDAKGRMAIPTKLRDALCGDTGGAVVVTISASDRCLLLYRLADWEQVEQKLIALPALNQQARQLKRMLLGHAEDCVMDGSGRILLSQQIREYANLDRKAVLVGQGDKYEIWEEASWVAQRETMTSTDLNESALLPGLETLAF